MNGPSRLELAVRFRGLIPDESPIDADAHARKIANLIVDKRRRELVAAATRSTCLAECLAYRAKVAGRVIELDRGFEVIA